MSGCDRVHVYVPVRARMWMWIWSLFIHCESSMHRNAEGYGWIAWSFCHCVDALVCFSVFKIRYTKYIIEMWNDKFPAPKIDVQKNNAHKLIHLHTENMKCEYGWCGARRLIARCQIDLRYNARWSLRVHVLCAHAAEWMHATTVSYIINLQ